MIVIFQRNMLHPSSVLKHVDLGTALVIWNVCKGHGSLLSTSWREGSFSLSSELLLCPLPLNRDPEKGCTLLFPPLTKT
jgi:hypothetical protein